MLASLSLSAQTLNVSSDKTAQASIQKLATQILKEKNKNKAETLFLNFFKNIGMQKEELFTQLDKSKPEEPLAIGSSDYQGLQREYETLLEVYIALDGLSDALAKVDRAESCSKFEHSYTLGLVTDSKKNKYTFYQTKVLAIAKHLCSQ